MGRTIHILCNDGSPLGVTEKTLRGEDGRLGVGGAELALLTMCRAWKRYGNKVILYNNPKERGASVFEQRDIDEFDPKENRDVVIIFRSPNEKYQPEDMKGQRVWWSCDSYTIGNYSDYASRVDKIVAISPYHSKYFKDMYGINNTIPIDLPVRTWEYKDEVKKISKRCIFTSIPDRGLMELLPAWARIVKEVPESSLVITSDWRLWVDWQTDEAIRHFKLAYAMQPNVTYRGAVKRDELVKIQMEADVHLYSCHFEEMFCISVAESQVAGVVPITSDAGALSTTNMGTVLHGNVFDSKWQDGFVEKSVETLMNPNLIKKQEWLREAAKKRFSVENILQQWEAKVFS